MIWLLTSLGVSQRLAAKVAPWALIALFALLAALAVAVWDHFDDKAAVESDRLAGNAAALEDQLAAETAAAAERVRNMVTNYEQTGDFHGAIHSPQAGDSVDPDIRLACEQLRRDGQDTTAIPECGRR